MNLIIIVKKNSSQNSNDDNNKMEPLPKLLKLFFSTTQLPITFNFGL